MPAKENTHLLSGTGVRLISKPHHRRNRQSKPPPQSQLFPGVLLFRGRAGCSRLWEDDIGGADLAPRRWCGGEDI